MFTSTNAGIGASVTTSLAAAAAAGALAVGLTAGGFAAASHDVEGEVHAAADVEATLTLEAQGEIDLPGPYLWVDGEGAVEIDDGRLDSELHFDGEGAFERTTTPEDESDAPGDRSDEGAAGSDESTADSSDAPDREETFQVAAAGSITVTVDAEGTISVTEIVESAGYEAYLIGWIGDTLIVEFESEGEVITALITELAGELTVELHAEATADAEAEAGTG